MQRTAIIWLYDVFTLSLNCALDKGLKGKSGFDNLFVVISGRKREPIAPFLSTFKVALGEIEFDTSFLGLLYRSVMGFAMVLPIYRAVFVPILVMPIFVLFLPK